MIPQTELALPFSGRYLRPLPFLFNYPINESWEFLTDIITSDAGNEQRIAVRNPGRPRRHIQATAVCFDRDEAQAMEALLFGNNADVYGVPLWPDAMELTADVTAGDLSISVDDTTNRDLDQRLADESDVPIMLWRAHDDYEVFLLSNVDTGVLDCMDALAQSWPKGQTRVVPLQLMSLSADPTITRPSSRTVEVALDFTSGQLEADRACGAVVGDLGIRVQMVRPVGHMEKRVAFGGADQADQANVGSLHPRSTDIVQDLFGYSTGQYVWLAAIVGFPSDTPTPRRPMYPSSKGRVTGLSKCTVKAPDYFFSQVQAVGLGPYTPGAVGSVPLVPGTDYTAQVLRDAGDTTVPTALTEHAESSVIVVGSSFSGTGYFGDPTLPPTPRSWVLIRACLSGGTMRCFVGTSGSQVSSYGRYDITVMGGVRSYPLIPETKITNHYVNMVHGYAFRLINIAAYKSVKIVTEEVLYSAGYPTWVESGAFGTPNVTTHDFTSDDYAAAATDTGAFVTVDAGSTTVFGGAHDEVGDAHGDHTYTGYDHGTDHELFRVTVSLVRPDLTVVEQFIDIFPTMLIRMALGT